VLTIEKLMNCSEYKSIVSNYDLNHLDNTMFLYELSKSFPCIHEIFDFVDKYNYIEKQRTDENEAIMLELINQSNNTSIKCLLIEKLLYKESHISNYVDLAKKSINELIQFLPKADTYAPSNRIEYLLNKLKTYLSPEDTKILLNEIFASLNNMQNLMNKYLARVFYKILTVLQDMNITSKAHFEFTKDLTTFALSSKPKDIHEFEIYDKIFDYAKTYTKPKKDVALQHANYIFSNLDLMHYTIRQSNLEKAVMYVSEFSDDQTLINQYKIELDKANNEVLNSIQSHNVPLGKDLTNALIKHDEMIRTTFESMSSFKLFSTLILSLKIITVEEIKEQSTGLRKSSFTFDFIPIVLVDPKSGKTIKTNDSSELAASNIAFNIIIQTAVAPVMVCFLNSFKMDQEVESFIEQLLINNPICRPTKKQTVKNAIIGILNKNFNVHLNNLISTFEDGLRYFFENSGISTTEFVRGHQSKIDMNDIFRDDSSNIFKNKLLEFMTDDMFSLIQLLSVGANGYNIRNKVMHGDFEDNDYLSLSAIYFAYLIILCYFGFYCNIEK